MSFLRAVAMAGGAVLIGWVCKDLLLWKFGLVVLGVFLISAAQYRR